MDLSAQRSGCGSPGRALLDSPKSRTARTFTRGGGAFGGIHICRPQFIVLVDPTQNPRMEIIYRYASKKEGFYAVTVNPAFFFRLATRRYITHLSLHNYTDTGKVGGFYVELHKSQVAILVCRRRAISRNLASSFSCISVILYTVKFTPTPLLCLLFVAFPSYLECRADVIYGSPL